MKQTKLHEILISKANSKHEEFSSKLKVNESYNILGLKSKEIKEIAKDISINEGLSHLDDFFSYDNPLFYEDVLIAYFSFSFLAKKIEINCLFKYLDKLLEYNNSWATNDTIALALIPKKKDLPTYFNYLSSKLKSSNSWDIRFGIVGLMKLFLTNEYIDKTLSYLNQIKNDTYYVEMALGWTYATALAKQREKTYPYLFDKKINNHVNKIAIQKAIESRRINEEDKIKLRILRDEINKLL